MESDHSFLQLVHLDQDAVGIKEIAAPNPDRWAAIASGIFLHPRLAGEGYARQGSGAFAAAIGGLILRVTFT